MRARGSPRRRCNGAASSSCARAERLIPTALTVAGGVNSVDHARTFPDLVDLLRAQARFVNKMHEPVCFLGQDEIGSLESAAM